MTIAPPQPQPHAKKSSALARLGFAGVASILWRYFKEKAAEQLKSIWFIIVYLIFFQVFILDLPIIYGATIASGIAIVVIGLTFFMEGLRLGLMPFGETIGAILPRNSKLPLIMGFSFILGVGATFAEPAIAVLKKAGSGVLPGDAPLLYSLLNDFCRATGRLRRHRRGARRDPWDRSLLLRLVAEDSDYPDCPDAYRSHALRVFQIRRSSRSSAWHGIAAR